MSKSLLLPPCDAFIATFPASAPPPPPPPPGLHRRSALMGTLAAVLAVPALQAAMSAVSPDAELLRLAEEFIALEARYESLFEGPNRIDDDRARDAVALPMWDRQAEIMDLLEDVRAKTPAGLMARVRMLTTERPELLVGAEDTPDKIIFDLIEDLNGMFGGNA